MYKQLKMIQMCIILILMSSYYMVVYVSIWIVGMVEFCSSPLDCYNFPSDIESNIIS